MRPGVVFHWRGEAHRILALRHWSGLAIVRRVRDGEEFGMSMHLIAARLAA
jgi:hypothetical protein